jgi:hypothetical protein
VTPPVRRRSSGTTLDAVAQHVNELADNTHFSEYGATQMAGLVLQGIREQNLPLTAFLR